MTEHSISLDQIAKLRDGSGHSIYGASGYAYFLLCHGALIPNLLVKDPGNIDAAYGTVGHMVAETWLKRGKRPDWLIGRTFERDGFEIVVDEEMLTWVQVYVDRCEMDTGMTLLTETHVDYSVITPIPNQGGTLDRAALRPYHALVRDLKLGKHETIFAKDNYQLYLYAYGIFLEYDWLFDFQTFTLEIVQPRIDHEDQHTITRAELLAFAAWAKVQMAISWQIDAPRTAGEKQCKYCKVRSSCAANALQQVQLTEGVFGDTTVNAEEMADFKERLDTDPFELSVVKVGQLSTAQIARLYEHRKTAEKFWKSLAAELFMRAQTHKEDLEPYGFKIVEGRSKRSFKSRVDAEWVLVEELGLDREDIFEEKLASPAKVEVMLLKRGRKKKDLPTLIGGLVHKPPGKPSIVPLHDKRETIADLSAVAFGDESENLEDEEI